VEIRYAASTSTHALHLQQNGSRLDGLHQGNFVTRDISGSVNGDQVSLASTVTERHGDSLNYRFSGKVSGEAIEGTVSLGEYLGATFTARRPQANA
jgi:L-seryl-tRNA(Ser) seleniumtransferase